MSWHDRIKKYYDLGLWSDAMVGMAVKMGKITAEQYTTITGQAYTA